MLWESEQVIEYFTNYGYIFLFFGLIVEGEVVLLTATLVAYLLGYSMCWFLLVTVLCAVLGDHIWYILGKVLNGKFIEKYGKFIFLPPARYDVLRKFLKNKGKKTFILSKFIYGMGNITVMASSVLGMSYKSFLRSDFIASFLWVGFNIILAFIFSKYFDLSLENMHYSFKVIIFIIIGLFSVQLISRYLYARFLKNR